MKYLAALLGVIGLALIAYLFLGKPITITVPEDKVRSEIAAKLPMTVHKAGVTALITALDVDFLADDAVHVDIKMDLDGYGLSGFAIGAATSVLRYSKGDFFLEDLDLGDLTITATEQSSESVDEVKTTASSMWNRFKKDHLDDNPAASVAIDKLKDRAMDKLMPTARVIADNALKTTPVYSLNGQDMKMDLAAIALVDVRFQAQSVEADLDPRNVILWILGWACIIAMSGIIAVGMLMGGSRTSIIA